MNLAPKIFSTNPNTPQNLFKIKPSLPSSTVRDVVGFSKMAGEDGHFKLSETSVIKINKGDITQWFIDGFSDAIINLIVFPVPLKMLSDGNGFLNQVVQILGYFRSNT